MNGIAHYPEPEQVRCPEISDTFPQTLTIGDPRSRVQH